MKNFLMVASLLCLPMFIQAQNQSVQDDFEGNGTITSWFGDDCDLNTGLANPFSQGINTSATVLEYGDVGGSYANVRFDVGNNFDLSTNHTFSLKIYVPSSGLTGTQTNQISLKLQDGSLGSPWMTQTEIVKTITLDQWQTLTFDFQNDAYVNLDAASSPPTQRTDFNRVLLQINGENNNDNVLAYVDDMAYDGTILAPPVFDNLIWADEFDTDGAINSTNWFHQTQLPSGGSWYNGEIQHYTNRIENSVVNNGFLKVIAKKENFTNQGQTKTHTSARLNSKFAFQYGRLEVRAKLPTGNGTWPAIWLLGKNINEDGGYWDNQGFGTLNWPACGEIDVMEHWGNNQNYIQSAMHTPSSFGGTVNKGGQMVATASTDFHIYALEWTAEKMVFSVDGIVHYTYDPAVKDAATWPFDAEQYILLNIAIEPGIDPNFTESAMEIDYVRIYQQTPTSTTSIDQNITQSYYPNPISDVLNVILAEATVENIVFNIHSIDGKLMQTQTATPNGEMVTLNGLGTLANGMYFVSYQLEGRVYSFKVVKQ
jgi:beta-glucanase (GH16 family)